MAARAWTPATGASVSDQGASVALHPLDPQELASIALSLAPDEDGQRSDREPVRHANIRGRGYFH